MTNEDPNIAIRAQVKEHFKTKIPEKETTIDSVKKAFFVMMSKKRKKECM
jgi:hypothetical protein